MASGRHRHPTTCARYDSWPSPAVGACRIIFTGTPAAFVGKAPVSRHDQMFIWHVSPPESAAGLPYASASRRSPVGSSGVHHTAAFGYKTFIRQGLSFKLVMDDTGALPAQHICTGLFTHVIAQMTVRCPNDFFAQTIQMLDQFDGDAGGHYPVCPRFNRCRGISVDHHGTIGVTVTEIRNA